MRLTEFDYNLPPELIAQTPSKPRDHSRLMVLDKQTGRIKHERFFDIVKYLHKGDVLVLNNSKVFPARLFGKKKFSRGRVEVFLHFKHSDFVWQCLLGGRGVKVGLEIEFVDGLEAEVVKNNNDGTWEVLFNKQGKEFMDIVNRIGKTPVPPYIKRKKHSDSQDYDRLSYQTVFADDNKIGSVAAPTAGLHFTPELLQKIKEQGVDILEITLHVGLGTFAPVKTDDIKKHKMHAEYVEIEPKVAKKIMQAKKQSRRIIGVGTTSVRALEAVLGESKKEYQGFVNIFIYPGYKFKIIDAMITNFHLPKSTLLMLVSALAGRDNIDKAYQEAIKQKYRFYSYGDAMMIC